VSTGAGISNPAQNQHSTPPCSKQNMKVTEVIWAWPTRYRIYFKSRLLPHHQDRTDTVFIWIMRHQIAVNPFWNSVTPHRFALDFVGCEIILASQLGMISSRAPMLWGKSHLTDKFLLHLLFWLLLLNQFSFQTLLHLEPKMQLFMIYQTNSKQIINIIEGNTVGSRYNELWRELEVFHYVESWLDRK